MTSLNVDLEDAIKTLKDLKESTPERIRSLREEMNRARFDLVSQRLLVKWYTWVTRLIEALGPDWRITGDGSYVDGYADFEDGDEDVYIVYIGGEIELYCEAEEDNGDGFALCIEDVGGAHLFWECPTTEKGMDLDVRGETAAHVASVINAKVAEVRASAKEQA